MRSNRRFFRCVSMILCVLLAVTGPDRTGLFGGSGDVAVVYAEEGGRTYEEYRSGENAPGSESGGKDAAGKDAAGEEAGGVQVRTELHISTEEELAAFAKNCELDSWSLDKYVVLDGDIALSEKFDSVIPGFGGVFEGNGHKISNLRIDTAGSDTGLFRYIREGAEVRNLSVAGRVQPGGSQSRVGILAGVNYGSIRNCSVSGSVAGDEAVGGIAGVNGKSGEIRQCSSTAVVAGNHKVGGICGENSGILNNCANSGSINTYSREVTYDLDDINMENLENLGDMSNVAAHMDTGGIAGCSEGKIYYCTNTGTVGYQHMGYNTGGIVGRLHQGYVQNCTNEGQIYGRKDVGGIAGQMEPFLEVQYLTDKLQEIDRQANRLLELLEQTGDGLQQYGGEVTSLATSVTTSLNSASDAAGNLLGTADYLLYVYNQELTGINTDMQRLNGDLKEQSEAGGTKDYTIDLGGSVSGGDLGDVTIQVPDNTEGYQAALRRFGENATGHVANIANTNAGQHDGVTENLDALNREMQAAADNLQKLSEALEEGTGRTGDDMDAVAAQAKALRKSIIELRDDLFRYEGITVSDTSDEAPGSEPGGEAGSGSAEGGTESVSGGDADGVTAAVYDTDSFQQGKITLCVNTGRVEADANAGGIVGQIAMEYDFDPEDDISFSGEESFNIERTIKAVVRESRNTGEILGKKDYVGGIVGKADFGAVISCESYGRVSSSGGSYVGGITGASGYAVRSCYFLGELSGKNYVGGIAGKGCDIFYSYACPSLELTGECGGSVAGTLAEDGILAGNYYVEGNIPGVDSVGYEGGAAPAAYDVFCNMEGVPEEFREFSIRFVADGREVAAVTYRYDEEPDLSQLNLAPPEKEGYYGIWPEIDTGSIRGRAVVEAQYIPWVSSLASAETDADGKALVLVQGRFRQGAELILKETAEGTQLSVYNGDGKGSPAEEYRGTVTVRALCGDVENAAAELYTGGSYGAAECRVVGSYLEFQMESPGIFRVVTAQKDKGKTAAIAAVIAAVVLLALITVIIRTVKKRKAKSKVSIRKGKQEAQSEGKTGERGGNTGGDL
ncbi:MAG: hypothetical protein NC123_02035 [Butyrivibrio sp.]|nr:hypothetical protein [Acetatifactor muris]MCM1558319.1 hypothetical protein [Butyrivibrio sp.]